ncbi:ImuA family protein [Rhizobium sp. RM]|uniref:ImuA family protein n=1 Tax=Rhizobium/Agrobacterium group TaxID=227290 RepID=UPI00110D3696|nr:ImuA family protein [Rhizobium sp. RM]NWJ23635.1 damage-inducible protein [Rhizobium sp. RM]TMV19466.1 damage-inducible protein [Rhizobium sp. Td3]
MHKRAEQLLVIEELRERLENLAGGSVRRHETLPFGLAQIDNQLPGGGLGLGCLHEVSGNGNGALDGASAALFAAGIAARLSGKVLWCVTRQDLFMPALAQAGLSHNRLVMVECRDEKGVLDCFEEGLRCNGFGAVLGEIAKLPMNASRRLQLAAETSGVTGIAIRRFRRQAEATMFGEPTAAVTRWRVSVRPSASLPVPGVGRARWFLELLRCRGGEAAAFEVEACDAKGRLALSTDMADGSLPEAARA